MAQEDVQEVEASIIDTPTVQTELDRAVAEAEQKAATVRERFMPHEIATARTTGRRSATAPH